jgi:glycosyltransferase involved in cell wall biosynthesis
MKFAFISTVCGYRWAGSEELWLAAALKALASGHQVAAFVHEDLAASEQIQDLAGRGAKIHKRRTLKFSRLWKLKEKFVPSFSLAELRSCDVVMVSLGSSLDVFYVPGLLGALQSCGVPYILFCQFNAEALAFVPAHRAALRELAAKSAGCGFVSQHNLALAERQLAMKLPNARVVFNPIRLNLSEPLPWPTEKRIRFACVARLETLWKGQDVLLEILSKSPWRERDWSLSFFGEGPDSEHLQNAVKFFGLESRVIFRGYVRELSQIWREHHLMILPSRGEGQPLAILEAMMCGRPTVTTDAGGNREILDVTTGFIAEAATPESFEKFLEQAWASQASWSQMGQAAHRRAHELAANEPAGQLLDYLAAAVRRSN